MKQLNILISGASIAGPALAYWLHRYGYRTTVVERAPAPRPGGQTVDLRGAGRTVVERMGLMEQVRAVTVDQRGLAMLDRRGRVTTELPSDLFGGEGIVSEIEVLRGDLAEILHSATLCPRHGEATEYLFDDTITDLAQSDDGVTVTFEKAAPRRFDLVIGADGLHSVVRGLAFGPESDHVVPLDCYMAWFTAPADDTLDGWFQMQQPGGGRVASLRPGRLPGETKAALSFRSPPLQVDRRDLAAQRRLVEERFAGLGWKVPWLLRAMHTASDFTFDSVGQVKLERWSRGRVALVGDAGYSPSALTGLGTSLALVGAYVLAGELAAAGGDHRVAFPRYDAIMAPYVASGQELPPMGAKGFAPGSRFMVWSSQASMRWMTRWPLRGMAAKVFAKADGIDLPAYEPLLAGAPG
ncbi:FAD-dependent monooxygenase [Pseudonocardia sp. GCM10023141]|uniref:FAD-dependent monooxygenase n=1 Tax=Pseudonocardia sp. GCM10023141 TaxID=3252653 RepID=UPI0036162C9B